MCGASEGLALPRLDGGEKRLVFAIEEVTLSRVSRMNLDFFKGESGIFFLINGLTALSFSFIVPIMTLFLVEDLGVEPGFIGFYTVGTALSTMVISQILGELTDRGFNSKILYLISAIAVAIGGFLFSFLTEFWQALMIGICFMSFGGASISVLLAMIRQFAERSGKNSTKVNSQMRTSISLLWIVGPAFAFASVEHFGMRMNFLIASGISLLVVMIAVLRLPSHGTERVSVKSEHLTVPIPMSVWVLGIGIFFASIANSAYINAMPLYLTKNMHFSLSFPGILLGMTAMFEIPVMLLAASWASKYGKIQLMIVSYVFAMCFYAGIQFASDEWAFLVLQLFNGLFFGTFVGLGVTLLQDFAPAAIGKISAFYTNAMTLGSMCGSSLMGLVAQYCGFKASLLTSLVSVFISFIIFCLFHQYAKRHRIAVETSI